MSNTDSVTWGNGGISLEGVFPPALARFLREEITPALLKRFDIDDHVLVLPVHVLPGGTVEGLRIIELAEHSMVVRIEAGGVKAGLRFSFNHTHVRLARELFIKGVREINEIFCERIGLPIEIGRIRPAELQTRLQTTIPVHCSRCPIEGRVWAPDLQVTKVLYALASAVGAYGDDEFYLSDLARLCHKNFREAGGLLSTWRSTAHLLRDAGALDVVTAVHSGRRGLRVRVSHKGRHLIGENTREDSTDPGR